MFSLLVKDCSSNKIFTIGYEPDTNTLINKQTFKMIKNPNKTGFFKEYPYKVSIILGVKCNLHCNYCIQSDLRNRVNLDFPPRKIKSFLEKFKKINLDKINTVIFWGGEPLVYWKTLTLLIPEIKKLCPNLKDFFLSTNATLLSESKLQFLLENNVTLQVSDDIFNDNRNTNLDSIRPLLNKAKEIYPNSNIGIHACYTKEFPDALKLLCKAKKEYNNSFDFRASPVAPPLYLGQKANNYSLPFNKDSAILLESSIYESCITNENFAYFDRKIKNFYKLNYLRGYACRFATQQEICLDVNGNMYACRGSFDPLNIIGNVETSKIPVISNKFKKVKDRAFCKNCPLISFCNGICSQLPDRVISKYCLGHYAFNRGIFRAILKKVYNLKLIKILNVDLDRVFQHGKSYKTLQECKLTNKVIYLKTENDKKTFNTLF